MSPLALFFSTLTMESLISPRYRSENKLSELSSLGHFLKGSSATLGFFKIKESCQEIQQYGNGLNVDGTPQPDKDLCLAKIREALVTAKEDTMELKKGLSIFFSDLDAE